MKIDTQAGQPDQHFFWHRMVLLAAEPNHVHKTARVIKSKNIAQFRLYNFGRFCTFRSSGVSFWFLDFGTFGTFLRFSNLSGRFGLFATFDFFFFLGVCVCVSSSSDLFETFN